MSLSNYYAFFNLKIGQNNAETYSLENNDDNMVEFTFSRIDEFVSDSLIFTLYDDSALYLEEKILNSDRSIEFWYGYRDGKQSPHYKGMIMKYSITFEGAGATLVLECVSQSAVDLAQVDTKEYEDMTPSEVMENIAKENDWIIKHVEPSKPIFKTSTGGLDKSNYKVFLRTNETLSEFIKKNIIPFSVSEKGKGGYTCMLCSTSEGTEMIYAPKNYVSEEEAKKSNEGTNGTTTDGYGKLMEAIKNYNYVMNAPSEEIISFTPEYGDMLSVLIGGNNVTTEYTDPQTNEYQKTETAKQEEGTPSKDKTEQEKEKERQQKETEVVQESDKIKGINRTHISSTRTKSEMEAISLSLWEKAQDMVYKATLVLVGDPTLKPRQLIRVAVLTRDGAIHHSTGNYYVSKITDSISDGTYITTLELNRNAMTIGDASTVDSSGSDPNYSGAGDPNDPEALIVEQNFVNYQKRTRGKMTQLKYIVIHNTEGTSDAYGERNYLNNRNDKASYHYVVDGARAIRCIPDLTLCNHVGGNQQGHHGPLFARDGQNHGIAIEICYSQSGGERFMKSEKNGAKLAAYLCKIHNLPLSAVKRHKDFADKDCPHLTMKLGWQRFMNMVAGYYNGTLNVKDQGGKGLSQGNSSTGQAGQNMNGGITFETTFDVASNNPAKTTLALDKSLGSMVYPVQGSKTINSPYGPRSSTVSSSGTKSSTNHNGHDLKGTLGTPVVAMFSGKVTEVHTKLDNSGGRYVKIDSAGGLSLSYLHLQKTFVSVGQQVSAGTSIGSLGGTGYKENDWPPHLHLTTRYNSKGFNAEALLVSLGATFSSEISKSRVRGYTILKK